MTQRLHAIIPNAADLLALEPEELGGVLLQHFNSLREEERRHFHRGNFLRNANAILEYPSIRLAFGPKSRGAVRQCEADATVEDFLNGHEIFFAVWPDLYLSPENLSDGWDGAIVLDFEDEITKGSCVTHDGEIVNERAKQMVATPTK